MVKQNILRRILYAGIGLVILVAILFPIAIILYLIMDKTGSATPGPAAVSTIVIAILHLIILYAFREALNVNKRNGHLRNVVYIVTGTGLLLLGLLILKIALEFLGYHNYYVSTIAFCFCFCCDFFAAIIALTAIFLQPQK